MNGHGRQVNWYGDKSIEYYEGGIKNDKRSGAGFWKQINGEEYDGNWENDIPQDKMSLTEK